MKFIPSPKSVNVKLTITPHLVVSNMDETLCVCSVCGDPFFHVLTDKEMEKHFNTHSDEDILKSVFHKNICFSNIKILSNTNSKQKTKHDLNKHKSRKGDFI